MTRWKGTLLAHVETARPYTLCYPGLVSLSGAEFTAAGLGAHVPAWRLVGAWAAPTLGWLGGLYGGDYFDRRLDSIAKPHRPIPSGRMPAAVAFAAMCACIAAAAVVTVVLNPWAVVLAAGTAAGGVGYSTVFKKRGLSGHLVRGGLMAAAFSFGAMAVGQFPPAWTVVCGLVFWTHDTGTNLVGALRDIDGDRAGGYQTLPVRRGAAAAVRLAAVLWLAWVCAAVVVLLTRPATLDTWLLLTAAAALGLLAVAKVTQTRMAQTRMTQTQAQAQAEAFRRAALASHEVLVVERLVLACAFLSLGAGAAVASTLLAAAVVVTLTSQAALRRRHEFGMNPEPEHGVVR